MSRIRSRDVEAGSIVLDFAFKALLPFDFLVGAYFDLDLALQRVDLES